MATGSNGGRPSKAGHKEKTGKTTKNSVTKVLVEKTKDVLRFEATTSSELIAGLVLFLVASVLVAAVVLDLV